MDGITLRIANGTPGSCSVLLEHGADLNERDTEGETPLHVASDMGMLDIVWLLVLFQLNMARLLVFMHKTSLKIITKQERE